MQQLNPNKNHNIGEIGKILNSLANEDALKIFLAAKEGIEKSTKTIKELKLTQRRYYLRLKELIKVGVIESRDDVYQLTTLGNICYTLGTVFNTALTYRSQLNLADKLNKTGSLSPEDTKRILQTISSQNIISSLGLTDFIQPVKMLETYEALVSEIINQMNNSKNSIYLASFYTDPRVVEVILKASERGVSLSLLSSKKRKTSDKLQILRMILNPNIVKLYSTFLDGTVRIKSSEFPFSFCVLDEKQVILELPNPITNSFYIGFNFESEILAKSLMKSFEDLYEKGKAHSILNKLNRSEKKPSIPKNAY